MRTIIVGLGNPILTDDAAGPLVVREVARRLPPGTADICEGSVGGLTLMEQLVGYDRAILIDVIQTGRARPGTLWRLTTGDLPASHHSRSAHDTDLNTALEMGRRVGARLPHSIAIIAIEAVDVNTFGKACTPEVAAAIPQAVAAVLQELADP